MRLPGTCVMPRSSDLPRVPAFTLRLPFSQTTPALPTGAKESSRLFLLLSFSLSRARGKKATTVYLKSAVKTWDRTAPSPQSLHSGQQTAGTFKSGGTWWAKDFGSLHDAGPRSTVSIFELSRFLLPHRVRGQRECSADTILSTFVSYLETHPQRLADNKLSPPPTHHHREK